jgi:hypothetical protein
MTENRCQRHHRPHERPSRERQVSHNKYVTMSTHKLGDRRPHCVEMADFLVESISQFVASPTQYPQTTGHMSVFNNCKNRDSTVLS